MKPNPLSTSAAPARHPASGIVRFDAVVPQHLPPLVVPNPANGRHAFRAVLASAACLWWSSGDTRADVVLEWNQVMEQTVMASNAFFQTRNAAMTQLAVFEAVNSIIGDYEPYVDLIPAPSGASAEAATIAAAHRVLVTLYPGQSDPLNTRRDESLALIPEGPAKADGIAVGTVAGDLMLALRADDGSNATVPYTPGSRPGDWQPTPPALVPAFQAGWGRVTPFTVADVSRFRPCPPPALRSKRFARDFNEVKDVGAVGSTSRPADRTDVARFYAVVLGVDCYNPAARQASIAQGKSLSENARNFALLNMALSDALITSMAAKYHYGFWRPVTAVRNAASDGNRRTHTDPDYLPLITTPPFPSYPSNHGSMAGAARAILERLFGPGGHDIVLNSPKLPSVTLHYSSWMDMADDVDDARIYGGIHYRFDQEAGARLGRRLGEDILRHELRRRR